MDISHFDFELDEVVDLIPRLTGLAAIIVLEPRSHQPDEPPAPVGGDRYEELHPVRSEPTYRVSCRLTLGGQAVQRIASFTTDTGVEIVLDRTDSARLCKSRQNRPL
jgi:hypothetical protein